MRDLAAGGDLQGIEYSVLAGAGGCVDDAAESESTVSWGNSAGVCDSTRGSQVCRHVRQLLEWRGVVGSECGLLCLRLRRSGCVRRID